MSRQTITYLQRKFAEFGLEPNPRHGQNFLIDLNLIDFIVRVAQISGRDCVLEVGTGTASLTAKLAETAGHVVTVEIDEHLFELARQQLASYSNVTQLHQDVLRNKNHLDATVLRTLHTAMSEHGCDRFKLVANLPYHVGTAVIANLLTLDLWPTQMTVTIQKELAERIVASPRTRDYSALSVWVQSLCDVRIDRILPASVFWPRPKVESAIVTMLPQVERRANFPDLGWYHRFVRALFLHRRKYLRTVLVHMFKEELSKGEIDEVMASCAMEEQARADQLEIQQIQQISEACRCRVPGGFPVR